MEEFITWFLDNIVAFVLSGATIVIGYVIFYGIKKQILRWKDKERFDDATAQNMIKLLRLITYIVVISIIAIQFAETLSVFTGFITVSIGTVIGFASMNTLGNLIAGIIIIASKPFRVGDRILFLERIADVVDIKLIYTILEDIDGVRISIPNQKLLKEEILNFGRNKILRREIFITPGYDTDPRLVEKALLEAAEKFGNILKYPEPRVDLYQFLDYAIKYRLIVFINNSKLIPRFDYQLKKAVYYTVKDYKIDITTPLLHQKYSGMEYEKEKRVEDESPGPPPSNQ
ncbi:MAG: mechanosensitive ion channel [Candidatus Lokiarchaeota archaeon]|nr:mechanosensitive ion channel [Candidatus Lokiarchaeota archaeon]MBD3201534.1 mechanosensitive ion channel [Candidatus Lokiarchaeota archaeon]